MYGSVWEATSLTQRLLPQRIWWNWEMLRSHAQQDILLRQVQTSWLIWLWRWLARGRLSWNRSSLVHSLGLYLKQELHGYQRHREHAVLKFSDGLCKILGPTTSKGSSINDWAKTIRPVDKSWRPLMVEPFSRWQHQWLVWRANQWHGWRAVIQRNWVEGGNHSEIHFPRSWKEFRREHCWWFCKENIRGLVYVTTQPGHERNVRAGSQGHPALEPDQRTRDR